MSEFFIDHSSVGIHHDDALKARLLAAVEASPLAGTLEWFSIEDGVWQGICPVGLDGWDCTESDMSFVVYSDDTVKALTGEVGTAWHTLALELLSTMATATRNDGTPMFSSAWPQVGYAEGTQLPANVTTEE